MYFCRGVACEYVGAFGTRTCVVYVLGFGGGPEFGQNLSQTVTGNPNTETLACDQYTVGSFTNCNPNPISFLTKLIVFEQKRNKY